MAARSLITQKQLKEVLSYSPRTGTFIWLRPASAHIKVGQIAGTKMFSGHRAITIGRRIYFAHRLAWLYMTGRWPAHEIDHRNGDESDNRFRNLREATHAQNAKNTRMHKNNRSGVKGVWWHPKAQKWQAQICSDGRRIYLGLFADINAAAGACREASRKHHGEFGRHQ